MSVMRSIGGVVAGIVAAGVVVFAVEAAGHALASGDALFAVAALGHGLAAALGSWAAGRIAGRRASIAVPLILAALAAINLFAFPHPWWFVPAAAAALAAGWFVGTRRRWQAVTV